MGRALVLKNVNFSENKLDTVNLGGEIPCTGISLSQDLITFTKLGSETLTAVVTPLDTTDAIVWSSSDSSVATVLNGVVTAVGLGTATITGTCGSQSATCSVTVSVSLSPSDLATIINKQYGISASDFQNGKDYQKLSNANGDKLWAVAYPTSMDGAYKAFSDTELANEMYPIMIPKNATTVTIGISSLIQGISVCYMNSKLQPTYNVSNKGARNVAMPSTSWSSHPTLTIPTDVEGLDSLIIVATFKEATTELPSGFEVTFA